MSIFLRLDLFAKHEAELFSQKKHQTLLGTLISVVIYMILSVISVQSLINLFEKSQPSITFSQRFSASPDLLQFNKNQFLMAFAVSDDVFGNPIDQNTTGKIFKASLTWWVGDSDVHEINFVQCDQQTIDRYNVEGQEYLKQLLTRFYCMNMTQIDQIENWFYLNGSWESDPNFFSSLRFEFYFCDQNNTKQCKLSNSSGFFWLITTDYIIDSTAPNPFKKYYSMSTLTYNQGEANSNVFEIQRYDIVDQFNPFFFGSNQNKMSGYQVAKKVPTKNVIGANIITLDWYLHELQGTYKRTYGTLLDIIAQVGGLLNAIQYLVGLLVYPIMQTDLNFQIQNKLEGKSSKSFICDQELWKFFLLGSESNPYQKCFAKNQNDLTISSLLASIRRLQSLEQISLNKQLNYSLTPDIIHERNLEIKADEIDGINQSPNYRIQQSTSSKIIANFNWAKNPKIQESMRL